MEPVITTIAAAVALGAAAGLKETASKAVTDAYAGLKKLIQDRYKKNEDVIDAVDYLIKKPEDAPRRQMLEQVLKDAGADKDRELAQGAEQLLAAVEEHNPEAAVGIGMDIGTLKAARLDVTNVLAAAGGGTGVKIGEAEIEGTATFSNIEGASPKR
ncbi:MAG: hypothetical protein D3906_07560 [Candidatus Electrothrix sp. AUS1_2]|nr:hypothetical protein [Candidatus Electrothrix sp. AUS1_2]